MYRENNEYVTPSRQEGEQNWQAAFRRAFSRAETEHISVRLESNIVYDLGDVDIPINIPSGVYFYGIENVCHKKAIITISSNANQKKIFNVPHGASNILIDNISFLLLEIKMELIEV